MLSPGKIFLISLGALVIIVLGVIFIPRDFLEEQTDLNNQYPMYLSSPAFKDQQKIPAKYACDGQNVSPPLQWSAIPERTKSLTLIIDDPDAPVGSWAHWIVWNIDPQSDGVPEGGVPAGGIEGITSFNTPGYGGPCPPSGEHHYYFRLYALDIELELDASHDTNALYAAMDGHLLGQAELMGTYAR